MNHEDLQRKLEMEVTPCVIAYNVNLREIKHLRFKNRARMNELHIWQELENEAERWIEWDGYFPEVKHSQPLERKQKIFVSIFNERVLEATKNIHFYYLSNVSRIEH